MKNMLPSHHSKRNGNKKKYRKKTTKHTDRQTHPHTQQIIYTYSIEQINEKFTRVYFQKFSRENLFAIFLFFLFSTRQWYYRKMEKLEGEKKRIQKYSHNSHILGLELDPKQIHRVNRLLVITLVKLKRMISNLGIPRNQTKQNKSKKTKTHNQSL